MKNAYLSRLVFFAFNQFAIICYLGFMAAQNDFIQQNSFVHFLLLSFLIFDAEYISYKNVKGNKTLNHFSLLLLLLGWQFLLYLFDFRPISDIVSTVLPDSHKIFLTSLPSRYIGKLNSIDFNGISDSPCG